MFRQKKERTEKKHTETVRISRYESQDIGKNITFWNHPYSSHEIKSIALCFLFFYIWHFWSGYIYLYRKKEKTSERKTRNEHTVTWQTNYQQQRDCTVEFLTNNVQKCRQFNNNRNQHVKNCCLTGGLLRRSVNALKFTRDQDAHNHFRYMRSCKFKSKTATAKKNALFWFQPPSQIDIYDDDIFTHVNANNAIVWTEIF